MHAKSTILKTVLPLFAAALLAHAGFTAAAPDSQSSAQQSEQKPDCDKNPNDSSCKKY